ncbi:unnamed protein product, partial [Discosporangium mesarthrocarpum]
DYSCAWDHKALMHGRLYVTTAVLCFYSNFLGMEARINIRIEDIRSCNKGNSALIVPNAISIHSTDSQEYVFRNFWDRDQCYNLI